MTRAALVLAAGLACAGPRAAAAAEGAAVDQARELYEAGGEAYRQGRYEVAIGAFEESRRLASHPAVTFSLAQSYRLQYFVSNEPTHIERAVALYREYLEQVPTGGRRDHAVQHLSTLAPILARLRTEADAPAGDEPAAAAQARLIVSSRTAGAVARLDGGEPAAIPATFEVEPGERGVVVEAPEHAPRSVRTVAVAGSVVALNLDLEPLPGQLRVRAPAGAAITLDGRVVGTGPLPTPVEVSPGRHLLVVTDRGRDAYVQQLEIGRGQSVELEADLSVSRQRVAAWTLFGAAGALLVGAGVTLGLALDKEADAEVLGDRLASRGLTTAELARYRELEEDRDELGGLAIGLGAASAAAALTGLLLWVFDEPDAPTGPLLAPAPGGAATGLGVRF